MSKRHTDTEKWERPWFRKLPPEYKALWLYILDKCDIAGIWYVDFDTASYFIGTTLTYDKSLELLNKQMTVLNSGSKWYVHDYVRFHCGELNSSINFHRAVRQRLIENGLTLDQECGKSDKDIHKHKGKHKAVYIGGVHFDTIWTSYPNKIGRKRAEKSFYSSIQTEQDFERIKSALENYKRSDRVKKNFVQNASTWFNNWEDWVEDPITNEGEVKQIRSKTKNVDKHIERIMNGSTSST